MVVQLFKLIYATSFSTNGVTKHSVTSNKIVAAFDAELERLFDASVGAGTSSGAFTVDRPGGTQAENYPRCR